MGSRLTGLLAALALAGFGGSGLAAQTGTVTGLVRDAVNLQPLAGAQLSVEGTGVGGLVNNVGRFLLLNVPAGEQTVTATLIGYGSVTQSVTVAPGATATLDFTLREQALSLEGVIVTGTAGTARRREIGNQISQVSAADIEVAAITDVGDILQGRSTGVQINDFGGQVGGGSQIRLRGNSSMGAGNDPLIYIDGVRMESNPVTVDGEAGASPSALDMINPNDIERIEIVKGPAATTLYGTEASGGVVQIFTKRGTAGAPAWALDVDQGLRQMGHQGGSLNGEDINPTGFYLNDCTVRREYDNTAMQFVTIPLANPGAEAGCPSSGSWFQAGHMQRYNLSVRGGGETATYFVSGRFDDEEGVVNPQQAVSYGVRANISFQPFDGMDISLNNSFQRRNITWIPDGNNASGFLLNVMRGSADYTSGNDALVFENDIFSTINQYQTSASVGWSPNVDWSHRLNVGLDYTVMDYLDWKYWDYFTAPTGSRRLDSDQDRNVTFDYTGSFSYNPLESVSSRLSFGGQLYEEQNYNIFGEDDSFAGPGEPEVGDGTNQDAGEGRTRVRSGGFFLQEQIGFQDKLFLTGGVRWDGFSTFGEGFGLAAYPKLSASYLLSDESFWPTGLVETLKLRAAWGASGKAPGVFEAEKLWSATSADEQEAAIVLDNFGNPDLGPERSVELELGFDASAFDSRVSLEFTWYDQTTKDALIEVAAAASTGTDNEVWSNLGEVKNWGTETSLTVVPVRSADVEWSVGAQYTTNDSEVVDLGPLIDLGSSIQLGLPLRIQWDAILQNPGEVGVAPVLEDGMIGRLFPTDIFALTTRLTLWQSLTIDVLGEGQFGHVRPVGHAYQNMRRTTATNPVWPYCSPILAQWESVPGPNTNRIANSGLTTDQIAQCHLTYSDQGIWTWDADFIKLRSATVSWRLPEGWVPGARNVLLSMQGKNLFTITDYVGLDPEAGDNGISDNTPNDYYTFGPPRALILGVTVSF
jgi:TonB-linked SusC/RagA family outer membrane protein